MKQFLDSVFAISGIMKVYIYIYIYMCVCLWYFLHHFPTPQYFLHLSRNRDQFVYGGKTINVSFEFKGKDTFFVRECLR